MTSQMVIFRAFLLFFFRPPTLGLKKNPVNQLIKKIWPHCAKLIVPVDLGIKFNYASRLNLFTLSSIIIYSIWLEPGTSPANSTYFSLHHTGVGVGPLTAFVR